MNQEQYEARKRLLKRIKNEWGERLEAFRRPNENTGLSRLSYAELIDGYCTAQEKLNRFIKRTVAIYALSDPVAFRHKHPYHCFF